MYLGHLLEAVEYGIDQRPASARISAWSVSRAQYAGLGVCMVCTAGRPCGGGELDPPAQLTGFGKLLRAVRDSGAEPGAVFATRLPRAAVLRFDSRYRSEVVCPQRGFPR